MAYTTTQSSRPSRRVETLPEDETLNLLRYASSRDKVLNEWALQYRLDKYFTAPGFTVIRPPDKVLKAQTEAMASVVKVLAPKHKDYTDPDYLTQHKEAERYILKGNVTPEHLHASHVYVSLAEEGYGVYYDKNNSDVFFCQAIASSPSEQTKGVHGVKVVIAQNGSSIYSVESEMPKGFKPDHPRLQLPRPSGPQGPDFRPGYQLGGAAVASMEEAEADLPDGVFNAASKRRHRRMKKLLSGKKGKPKATKKARRRKFYEDALTSLLAQADADAHEEAEECDKASDEEEFVLEAEPGSLLEGGGKRRRKHTGTPKKHTKKAKRTKSTSRSKPHRAEDDTSSSSSSSSSSSHTSEGLDVVTSPEDMDSLSAVRRKKHKASKAPKPTSSKPRRRRHVRRTREEMEEIAEMMADASINAYEASKKLPRLTKKRHHKRHRKALLTGGGHAKNDLDCICDLTGAPSADAIPAFAKGSRRKIHRRLRKKKGEEWAGYFTRSLLGYLSSGCSALGMHGRSVAANILPVLTGNALLDAHLLLEPHADRASANEAPASLLEDAVLADWYDLYETDPVEAERYATSYGGDALDRAMLGGASLALAKARRRKRTKLRKMLDALSNDPLSDNEEDLAFMEEVADSLEASTGARSRRKAPHKTPRKVSRSRSKRRGEDSDGDEEANARRKRPKIDDLLRELEAQYDEVSASNALDGASVFPASSHEYLSARFGDDLSSYLAHSNLRLSVLNSLPALSQEEKEGILEWMLPGVDRHDEVEAALSSPNGALSNAIESGAMPFMRLDVGSFHEGSSATAGGMSGGGRDADGDADDLYLAIDMQYRSFSALSSPSSHASPLDALSGEDWMSVKKRYKKVKKAHRTTKKHKRRAKKAAMSAEAREAYKKKRHAKKAARKATKKTTRKTKRRTKKTHMSAEALAAYKERRAKKHRHVNKKAKKHIAKHRVRKGKKAPKTATKKHISVQSLLA
jgi:hypothetical protein